MSLLSVHFAEVPLAFSNVLHYLLLYHFLFPALDHTVPSTVKLCGVVFKRSVSHGLLKINESLDGDKGRILPLTGKLSY